MIKKQIIIDLEYGTEYQYRSHHPHLIALLTAFEWGMFGDTNYTMFRHKDNRYVLSGDTQDPEKEEKHPSHIVHN